MNKHLFDFIKLADDLYEIIPLPLSIEHGQLLYVSGLKFIESGKPSYLSTNESAIITNFTESTGTRLSLCPLQKQTLAKIIMIEI